MGYSNRREGGIHTGIQFIKYNQNENNYMQKIVKELTDINMIKVNIYNVVRK